MQGKVTEDTKAKDELKTSPLQLYRDKVSNVKDSLPDNYVDIIIKHYPEYNNVKGYNLIKNVRSLHTADVKLTGIFEKIANKKLTL